MSEAAGGRLTRGRWLDLGLDLLGREGPDALLIDRLCVHARRTKGSFYHHFEDHDDFLRSLLGQWRDTHTEAVIRAVDAEPDNRLLALNRLATALDPRVEVAIRRLAGTDDRAREAVMAVDARRMEYLAGLYRDTGRFDPPTCRALAELEYAIFVGLHHMDPDARPSQMQMLYETFGRLVSGERL